MGSNLGESRLLLARAMDALDAHPQIDVVARSRFFRTPPWGVLDQPDFVNAVVAVTTTLSPDALLARLLDTERQAGRVRDGQAWGPRTLDLDLLLYEGVARDDPHLTLPHPRMAERAFVLLPLADIAPDLIIPGKGRVSDLLAAVDSGGCQALS
nr:2-amino-4-hydroxy-6-hydroxymethyldihydropteridine diphosphokinase [Luteibacter sp. Sphag1AF]